MKSKKEITLDKKILNIVSGKTKELIKRLLNDKEIEYMQDYANSVSITRLHYNDHGPVHMRKVLLNALILMNVLKDSNIKLNLENEGNGDYEDSVIAVTIAAFLHDIGMSVARDNHEISGIILAMPVIERLLNDVYGNDLAKIIIIRSLIAECIMGHMGTQKIHSLEAGILLIADGCDMEKGRARIPMIISTESRIGDIHKYSSSAIEKVVIERGSDKPIKITVKMSESVGFFQVEEVLLTKINSSPVKEHIELYAGIENKKLKRYV